MLHILFSTFCRSSFSSRSLFDRSFFCRSRSSLCLSSSLFSFFLSDNLSNSLINLFFCFKAFLCISLFSIGKLSLYSFNSILFVFQPGLETGFSFF